MKSFRLDPNSVTKFLRSWPVFVAGGLIGSAIVVVGRDHSWSRFFIPLVGICLGPRLFVGRMKAVPDRTPPVATFDWNDDFSGRRDFENGLPRMAGDRLRSDLAWCFTPYDSGIRCVKSRKQ